jgi:hypothetical protein
MSGTFCPAIFGHFGDRVGRKTMLAMTIVIRAAEVRDRGRRWCIGRDARGPRRRAVLSLAPLPSPADQQRGRLKA